MANYFTKDNFTDFDLIAFSHMKQYLESHGNLIVPIDFVCKDGFKLGDYVHGKLNQENYIYQNKLNLKVNTEDDNFIIGFNKLKQYFEKHGHSLVPTGYKCEDGFKLFKWVTEARNGYLRHTLTMDQIAALKSVKMVFRNYNYESTFLKGVDHAKSYFEKYGNLLVPFKYVCDDGFKLGAWIKNRISEYERKYVFLYKDKIKLLESMGISWDWDGTQILSKYENGLNHAKVYLNMFGNFKNTSGYKMDDGFKLGEWMDTIFWRALRGRLPIKVVDDYRSLGYDFDFAENLKIIKCNFNAVEDDGFVGWSDFKDDKGNLLSHGSIRFMHDWWMSIITIYEFNNVRADTYHLLDNEIEMLKSVGMKLPKQYPAGFKELSWFDEGFLHAEQYYKSNKNLLVPEDYICEDDFELGKWIYYAREYFTPGSSTYPYRHTLSEDEVESLDSIEMVWKI